jgi:POT family proton-dependent oligopeptide transporter
MAAGALIVAVAYTLVAIGSAVWTVTPWAWLVLFFAVFTMGELFILPTGLGLFARLAPVGLGATTVAAWYLAIFAGSLAAGLVGTLWSKMTHPVFFAVLAAIAATAALLLWMIEPLAKAETA